MKTIDSLIVSVFALPNTVWWVIGLGLVVIAAMFGYLLWDMRDTRLRVKGYDFSSQDSRRKEG